MQAARCECKAGDPEEHWPPAAGGGREKVQRGVTQLLATVSELIAVT
jgi:hypothetical protein